MTVEFLKLQSHTLFVYDRLENRAVVQQDFGVNDADAYDALDTAQEHYEDTSRYGVFLLGQRAQTRY